MHHFDPQPQYCRDVALQRLYEINPAILATIKRLPPLDTYPSN